MKKQLLFLFFVLIWGCHKEQTIPVSIDVVLHVKDNNYTSPLHVAIENLTKGADGFEWTFEGGEPATSSQKDPGTVTFTEPGEHTITLDAWNDGERKSKTYTIRVDNAVSASFKVEAEVNNYAPAVFHITNLSEGGTSYTWTFEGGEPGTYEGADPPPVTYSREGTYTISLTAENGSAEFTSREVITVREPLDASFTIIPSLEDEDDMEAPVRATFDTHLQGVETLLWTCEGATITHPEAVGTDIYFPQAGRYTVYLEVSNGKESKRLSQQITVKANTNLRTHKDIRMGINTAGEMYGTHYSTKLRRLFKASEIDESNGPLIDIIYFGLNTGFTYNLFVSPDAVQDKTSFPAIPDALPVTFINKSEKALQTLSPGHFNSMSTDESLLGLSVTTWTNYIDEAFDNEGLPRVVLFETGDGRKGAILVKEMVSKGKDDSYITVDIKVQKND